MLDGLTVRLDGKPAAPSVVSRRRKILNTAVEYAVERKLLPTNPIPALKWTPPRTTHSVDRRSVANPVQVRTLLDAVRAQKRSGPRFVAFFGCLYFAAMRPEEAVALAKHHLVLPADGVGRVQPQRRRAACRKGVDRQRPESRPAPAQAAGAWRGSHRARPPESTELLNWHLGEFGTASDGRLFTGERNAGRAAEGHHQPHVAQGA